MKKSPLLLMLVLVTLMALLAACAGGGADGTPAATEAVPETGAGAGGDTTATEAAPTVGADPVLEAAECAGVDTQELMTTGETVYLEQCASCHGEMGEGVGDFPPLAGSANVTGADADALVQAYFAIGAHPQDISPDNLAAVLTYSRASFGNTASPVCPADVTVPAAP